MRPFSTSRAIGSSIGTIIGLLWFLYGTFLIHEPYRYILLIFGLAITFYLFRKIRRALREVNEKGNPTSLQTNPYKHTALFFIINTIVEIVLLNVVLNYLIKIGHLNLIIPAISIVVGLHFVPMAIFLRFRQFYISSILMVVSGIVLMKLSNMLDENPINIYQSILNAGALWVTVVATLKNTTETVLHS